MHPTRILIAAVISLFAGVAIALYSPPQYIDYAILAGFVFWAVFFEWTSWNFRPERRLLRLATRVVVILVAAWVLYPFNTPMLR